MFGSYIGLCRAYDRLNGLQNKPCYMGKARDFKNHVTPAVFSFVVTSTYV